MLAVVVVAVAVVAVVCGQDRAGGVDKHNYLLL